MQVGGSDRRPNFAVDYGTLGAQPPSGILDQVFDAAVDWGHCIVRPHTDPEVGNVWLLFEARKLGPGHTSKSGSRVRQHLEQYSEIAARPAKWAEHAKIGRRQ
tara:strand:- start:186 stop:494 length:309 start_codon:yes stop_codon:yes gene_type:complete